MTYLDELLVQRHSVRNYEKQMVEKEKLLQCVNAARLAPSARNNQPWKFIITTEEDILKAAAEAIHKTGESSNIFVHEVPAIITLVYEDIQKPVLPGRHPHSYFYDIDHGLAIGYLILKATELGLGTCILGNIANPLRLKKILGLSENDNIKIVITIGYPKEKRVPEKVRKALDEIIIS